MSVAAKMDESRARRMKAASAAAHDAVDRTITAARPFDSREAYGRFLDFQLRLHRRVAPLYAAAGLNGLLPDLEARARLAAVEADFADLARPVPPPPAAGPDVPLPEALGWLYVVEGSNMGAALLSREARRLGLSDDFGARHLAGHPDGRARHWRAFTAALDAVPLGAAEEERAEAAVIAAFAYVLDLVGETMGEAVRP